MKISVVIPTYKRRDKLEGCLRALFDQSIAASDFEVIVADNAADPETKRLVDSYALQADFNIAYVDAGRQPGPAFARNFGAAVARAELIAFTDDDTIPGPNWLAEGLRTFRSVPRTMAVTGRVVVPTGPGPLTDHELNFARLETAEFITANCFIRKDLFNILGGFDEGFTSAWREDSDLHFSLIEAGFAPVHCSTAVVVHPMKEGSFCQSFFDQKKSQFDALLFKKHERLFNSRIGFFAFRYYISVAAALASVIFALIGIWVWAAAFLLIWLGFTVHFAVVRLHSTKRDLDHILEMCITSLAIPPAAVFWRLRGAFRFRVFFF